MRRLLFAVWTMALLLFGAGSVLAAQTVVPSDRVKRNVVIRQEPTTRSEPLGSLAPGDEAELREEVPGWYGVRTPNGIAGFVSKSWTILMPEVALAGPVTSGTLKIHVIDVGTGLATFVEGPGFTMLYDGGSQDDLADGASNRILAYIRAVRPELTTIDHLVLSHPHKDHLELLPDVFDRYVIRNVWDSGAVNKTRGYCRFLKKVEAEPGVSYHDAIATGGLHEVTFSGSDCNGTVRIREAERMSELPVALDTATTMSILYRDATHHSDPNGNSVVVRLDFASRRVLMVGDAEAGDRDPPSVAPKANSIEGVLLACCMAQLRSDVLVVGHHGSSTSSRRSFLDAVGASIFVVSSGPHPYSGVQLPDAAVVSELSTRGQLFRTDVDDADCTTQERKVGPDADESPGGCSNVAVTIGAHGELSASYLQPTD